MKLIDVSAHNGVVDWAAVKADGIDGVILRAGFGKSASQEDSRFNANYSEAKAAGLYIGAYWYSYAASADEARKEAAAFLSVIKGKSFELPIFLDLEDKSQVRLSRTVCTDIAETFLGVLEAAGYFAGIYSFDSFFATNLDARIRKRYAVWVARVENIRPEHATEWGIWQYSWKGRVNGVRGCADLDSCVKNYPEIIRRAGLNGCKAAQTYCVTASAFKLSAENARKLEQSCTALGMNAVTAKE